MHSGYFSLASHIYIATANAPLSDRFQEMLDMLMTGAAFGLPTALWLTNDCVSVLNALPANDSLLQLADFGVRCVVSDSATTGALQAEALNGDELRELRTGCQQVLVF